MKAFLLGLLFTSAVVVGNAAEERSADAAAAGMEPARQDQSHRKPVELQLQRASSRHFERAPGEQLPANVCQIAVGWCRTARAHWAGGRALGALGFSLN